MTPRLQQTVPSADPARTAPAKRASAVQADAVSVVVVIGGRHNWLPPRIERWRRALEDAGHFVFLVNPSVRKEPDHA